MIPHPCLRITFPTVIAYVAARDRMEANAFRLGVSWQAESVLHDVTQRTGYVDPLLHMRAPGVIFLTREGYALLEHEWAGIEHVATWEETA